VPRSAAEAGRGEGGVPEVARSGKEARQVVAPDEQIRGAEHPVLRVAHDSLGDDRDAGPHRLDGLDRLLQARYVGDVSGDGLDVGTRGQVFDDRVLEASGLVEDESGEVAAGIVVRKHVVPLESPLLAVHVQPVEQGILDRPVAGLRGGDPVVPLVRGGRDDLVSPIVQREGLDSRNGEAFGMREVGHGLQSDDSLSRMGECLVNSPRTRSIWSDRAS